MIRGRSDTPFAVTGADSRTAVDDAMGGRPGATAVRQGVGGPESGTGVDHAAAIDDPSGKDGR